MKKIAEKNQQVLDKNVIPAQETVVKQEIKKAIDANSVLNKYLETDEEYDARLAELRKQDYVNTREINLKHVEIPGHTTIWASTDPKAKPSIMQLKARGYRIVNDVDFVPTGSHSVEGAGFHILMACPNDIATKRKAALDKRAKDDMERVFKKKIEVKDGEKDFLYQENTFAKGKASD
jgi:hypothetical protein